MVGYERSIVFDQPGTTRDRIETDIIIDGWPFQLIDTAGVRNDAQGAIEQIGVQAARISIRGSDVCVLVVDSTVGWSDDDEALLVEAADSCPVVLLWNKADLPSAQTPPERSGVPVIRTSTTSGAGMQELLDWLPGIVIPSLPEPHEPLPLIGRLLVDSSL